MAGVFGFDDWHAWMQRAGTFEEVMERLLQHLPKEAAPKAHREIKEALTGFQLVMFGNLPDTEKDSVLRAAQDAFAEFNREPPEHMKATEERWAIWQRIWRELIEGMERRIKEGPRPLEERK